MAMCLVANSYVSGSLGMEKQTHTLKRKCLTTVVIGGWFRYLSSKGITGRFLSNVISVVIGFVYRSQYFLPCQFKIERTHWLF